MKVTLQSGRELDFSKEELKDLKAILDKQYSSEATEKVTTAKVAKVPTEGQCFEVKPLAIDQKLFQKKRKDARQEATRQLILEAFEELKKNPEKYGRNFKTMIPGRTLGLKNAPEFKDMACKLGDHIANWVEQALEWAQRIANGESWKAICNDPDTTKWFRAVVWKNGNIILVGGSVDKHCSLPASNVDHYCYLALTVLNVTVPLVVLYEK